MTAPDRERVLAFVRDSDGPVGRRRIARALGIGRGPARDELYALLRELEEEGALPGRRRRPAGKLPKVGVIEVTGRDEPGNWRARPVSPDPAEFERDGGPPPIRVIRYENDPRLDAGLRILARLTPEGNGGYMARIMKVLNAPPAPAVVGVVEPFGGGLGLHAATRGRDVVYPIPRPGDLEVGDVVSAELRRDREFGRVAKVVRRIGRHDGPGTLTDLSLLAHGIEEAFPEEVLAEAAAPAPPGEDGREDLRDLPLVTIDGEDARDFDDAVFAEPDGGGGWRVVVAIADVAWYVRPGTALDREAERRGNSAYFPDRVVPMLPESLSAGLCSLAPGEDRACLALEMRIGPRGRAVGHRFARALMRSRERLTYERAQEALDGGDAPEGLRHLEGAWRALAGARSRRGSLDLDLPEIRVRTDADGHVESIGPRPRLDTHRIIEELMVAANVAAAETLERAREGCLFRVHERPERARVEELRNLLRDFGMGVRSDALRTPKQFGALLARVRGTEREPAVNELVLRCQSQAVYAPVNTGHFGLGLARYAHFTSPIRRYPDLLVHRALIAALGLGEGGAPDGSSARLHGLGEHLSRTERRAAAAEREAVDRYVALWLSRVVGETFEGRIVGVQRFGLFVRIAGLGVDGLLPVEELPDDWYDHNARHHVLVGRRRRRNYRLGDGIAVRLAFADAFSGSVLFDAVGGAPGRPGRGGRSGKNRRRA